jgi:hypothetical protein
MKKLFVVMVGFVLVFMGCDTSNSGSSYYNATLTIKNLSAKTLNDVTWEGKDFGGGDFQTGGSSRTKEVKAGENFIVFRMSLPGNGYHSFRTNELVSRHY